MSTEREVRETIQRLERQDAVRLTIETLQKNKREAVKLWVMGFVLCVVCVILSVVLSVLFLMPLVGAFVIVCWAAVDTADAIGDIEEFQRKERLENE
jgi:Na+/H+ antiporter NhaD/arsenite permease-like protein